VDTLVCVDTGTTNTRVWLTAGERLVARREVPVGARDTARDGQNGRLRAALREALEDLLRARPSDVPAPRLIAAAGMITSPQGLLEVPHVSAPAGVAALAAAGRHQRFPEIADLPFFLVPGVRTIANGTVAEDVMRGEETLCLGLLRMGLLPAGGALLNLGSHWKLVRTDEAGRIARSVTSLAGEMIQAVRTQTILASALPKGPLVEADLDAVAEGMRETRRSGLPRALFRVRLLELAGQSSPTGRLSFATGAFIATDLDGLRASGALPDGIPLTISGGEKVGGAWEAALSREGHPTRSLTAAEVEAGFLAGLRAVTEKRGSTER
jgi:2-dehydro-3-deoxygalactonokinase